MTAPEVRPHAPIPAHAGIGLRSQYERTILADGASCGWLEAHSENYFGPGGGPINRLLALRETFPISLHGVGLGLGNADPLEAVHLDRLAQLVHQVEPRFVSEHLCWNAHAGRNFNDLLPLPFTAEAIRHVSERIIRIQDVLGRRILIENVSSYLEFEHAEMSECAFLREVAERADCGILLDVNNIYVNANNHGYNALEFIAAMNPARVEELHLAGHTRREFEDGAVLWIDTHDRPVSAEVWTLYRETVDRLGPRPTLIEWDANFPPLCTLEAEARTADRILQSHHAEIG